VLAVCARRDTASALPLKPQRNILCRQE